jgi:hypothetical protein
MAVSYAWERSDERVYVRGRKATGKVGEFGSSSPSWTMSTHPRTIQSASRPRLRPTHVNRRIKHTLIALNFRRSLLILSIPLLPLNPILLLSSISLRAERLPPMKLPRVSPPHPLQPPFLGRLLGPKAKSGRVRVAVAAGAR